MDLLPIVSLIGLTIAVLVLGLTVATLVRSVREARRLSAEGTSSPGRLGLSHGGSITENKASLSSSMPTMGFPDARRAFRKAFLSGDVKSAIETLPKLERTLGREHPSFLLSVSVLAAAGERVEMQPLLDAINSDAVSDESTLKAIIAGTVQHYVARDREQEGLEKVEEALKRNIDDASRPNAFRAHVANQLQMLYFGADGRTDNALDAGSLAIELSPMEPHYHFNLSMIHEKRGDLQHAIGAIERCLEIGKNAPDDHDHILQAWNLYRQTGDEPNMEAMKRRLEAI